MILMIRRVLHINTKVPQFFIGLVLGFSSCSSVQQEATKRLDIQAFAKHQADGAWRYTETNGNEVLVQKESNEYWESITSKGDCFTRRNNYYLNGRLKSTGQYFHDNGFNKAIWTYYDQNGKVIKTQDEDAAYKPYSWEKVLTYLKKNGVNIQDKQTNVNNESGPKGTFWLLSWKTGKINLQGLNIIKHVRITVNTGQVTNEKETYCCID